MFFSTFNILRMCACSGYYFVSYTRPRMSNKRCGMGREFLIIPTSSQNDITLPQLNASIASHKSARPDPAYCTAVKGVKCPEMMLTMAIKATLRSCRVSAAIKSIGFSIHLWKRAPTEDVRIFISVRKMHEKLLGKTYRLARLVVINISFFQFRQCNFERII